MDEYEVSNIAYTEKLLCCDVRSTAEDITESFRLDLNGFYQTKNLCTVLCSEGALMQQGFIIKNAAEKNGLQNVKKLTGLHGRWDVVREDPTLILDVAHNEDGIKQVLSQLGKLTETRPSAKIHFVTGMVKDKEVSKVLSLLPSGAHYYFTNAHIPRALPHEELKEKAAGFGLHGESFDEVNTAIKAAMEKAIPGDIILVCGSVFVVGEVDTVLFS